ncbi:YfdX family protein [Pseudoroseicyclus aestuarii]|uniref:YfdX protein n=1 Tax=Pseudoroseicyclus aestuarii TaxID=1795041 RepID=A0A318SQE8_9RHOB|nr:YfdX family protein [Pseudoroseicyclus aestuarii]PYE83903.1 YfdX protein [Pseudoroseicyclus aestuarii]
MKRNTLLGTAMAVLMSSAAVVPAFAQDTATSSGQTTQQATEQTAPAQSQNGATNGGDRTAPFDFQVSSDAASGLRDVQLAQIALMTNRTDNLSDILDRAQTAFQNASGDAVSTDQLTQKADGSSVTGAGALSGDAYFPVAMSTMLSERASLHPQDDSASQSTANADGASQTGKPTSLFGIDEIDLRDTVTLLPQQATLTALDDATKAAQDSDWDGVRTALASIQGSLILGTSDARGVPSGDQAQAQVHNTSAPADDAATQQSQVTSH